jgi:hypothetical protein
MSGNEWVPCGNEWAQAAGNEWFAGNEWSTLTVR